MLNETLVHEPFVVLVRRLVFVIELNPQDHSSLSATCKLFLIGLTRAAQH